MKIKEISILALKLCIIPFIITLLITLANNFTSEKIEKNTSKTSNLAMSEVLPGAESFSKNISNDKKAEIYEGKDKNGFLGYAVSIKTNGYGGEITLMVGIDKDEKVTGVNIVSFSETPGLGSKTKEPDFLVQYKNENPPFKVGENINAISGATISSKAVTLGVNNALEAIKNLK